MYEYVTENNLEHKQHYMYSEFRGATFLDEYVESRERFIASCEGTDPDLAFIPKSGPTLEDLTALLAMLKKGVKDAKIDDYTKIFEVRKRLWTAYDDAWRPVEGAKYNDAGLYILLAECEIEAYRIEGCLKYISCLLKIDDTLISIASSMTLSQMVRMRTILQIELDTVREIATRNGIGMGEQR